MPLAVAVAAGAGIASDLVTKMAARPVVMIGLALTVAGLLLMWRAPADGSYAVDLLAPFILLGLGCGMVFVTLQIAAFVGVSDKEAGVGAGLINTSQEAGGALGLAVVATIAYSGMGAELAAAGSDPEMIAKAHEAANHDAFLSGAVLGAVALLIVATLMPRGKASMQSKTEAAPADGPEPVRANAGQ